MDSITILGCTYRIEYVELKEDLYGDCNTGVIRVNRTKDREEQWSTVVHEVLHGILHESGLTYALGDDNMEEGIVRALEHGLMRSGLIRSNPLQEIKVYDTGQ